MFIFIPVFCQHVKAQSIFLLLRNQSHDKVIIHSGHMALSKYASKLKASVKVNPWEGVEVGHSKDFDRGLSDNTWDSDNNSFNIILTLQMVEI